MFSHKYDALGCLQEGKVVAGTDQRIHQVHVYEWTQKTNLADFQVGASQTRHVQTRNSKWLYSASEVSFVNCQFR